MKKNKSTLFFSGMQVRFKHEDEGDAYAGRMWYFQKLLPNNKAELITLEGDVQCITDINNIEPDCTIKDYALRLISQGKSFRIDLKERNLTVDGLPLITDGIPAIALDTEEKPIVEILEHIEDLYARYKRSIPSKNDTNYPSKYFLALREELLSNEDMMYGEQRSIARFKLEFYVLQEIIKGTLRWDKTVFGEKAWFWQSLKDKSLIICKGWIEP